MIKEGVELADILTIRQDSDIDELDASSLCAKHGHEFVKR